MRRGIKFSNEDEILIAKLQKELAKTMGSVSLVQLLRWAIRQAEKSL